MQPSGVQTVGEERPGGEWQEAKERERARLGTIIAHYKTGIVFYPESGRNIFKCF